MNVTRTNLSLALLSALAMPGYAAVGGSAALAAASTVSVVSDKAMQKNQTAEVVQKQLQSGRRMLVLEVPTQNAELRGRAPEGTAGTYRILNGVRVLWEGKSGEAFCVEPDGLQMYLLSVDSDNKAWQELRWQAKHTPRAAQESGNVVLQGGSNGFAVPANGEDAGPAIRAMLAKAAQRSVDNAATTIELPKGEYHFYPETATQLSYYISNHDQQSIQPVGLPIVGIRNLEINGNGSTFVFHGAMQPVLLMDSENVRLNNISIKHDAPYYNEGKIVEIKDGTTLMEFSPLFRWEVKDGRYYLTGDGTRKAPGALLAFEADGRMVATGKAGDIPWPNKCEQVSATRVRFFNDAAKHGLSVGQVGVLRHYGRPHPAMVLYRAVNTQLNQVVFRDSQGMALIAQRSKDITINGGGCVCDSGRVYTVSADATHFSNCAGTISVNGAKYEGMMDDAINVHSTCLKIEKMVGDREIVARYMHPQAVGFEVFAPGEKVQFIRSQTLENHPTTGVAERVEKLDENTLRITLRAPLPAEVQVGDAIENADWYPAVNFTHCTVQHNRARGTLFTTPKPVLVQDCKFIGSSGSAILLAGDARGWYESGRCLDVKIINNLFDHNLIQRYQFTEGIISIYPEVARPQEQQVRYHRNILIEGNTFLTHRVPLIYAISADGIIFRNNTIRFDDKHAPMHGGKPYVLKHCGHTELQQP